MRYSDKVGATDARKRVKDGKSIYLFNMKEPDFTMILLSTFGTLTEVEIGGGTARMYKDSTTGNVTKNGLNIQSRLTIISSSVTKLMTTTPLVMPQLASGMHWG